MTENREFIKDKLKIISSYLITAIWGILLALFIITHIVCLATIVGTSMLPTLDSGDIVILNKLPQEYNRFDIIVIDVADELIVKRVIGTPGDTVHIRNGRVYINEEELEDVINEHIEFSGLATSRVRLGEGEYFVLGDNRSNSKDSRYPEIGTIKEAQIIGQVVFSVIPFRTIK